MSSNQEWGGHETFWRIMREVFLNAPIDGEPSPSARETELARYLGMSVKEYREFVRGPRP